MTIKLYTFYISHSYNSLNFNEIKKRISHKLEFKKKKKLFNGTRLINSMSLSSLLVYSYNKLCSLF